MKLSEFLRVFDFSYDITKNNEIRLIDLEGVNLGEIEEDRFPIGKDVILRIIERLDTYINDVIVQEFERELYAKGVNCEYMDLEAMSKKAKELEIEDVCYEIADAIVNPEKVEIDKILDKTVIDYDESPKTWDYKWINFLSGSNVVEVKNAIDFSEFKEFLDIHDLLGILNNTLAFEDWQHLAKINNRNPNIILFEYNNSKGLTWLDNRQEAIDWYGEEPITTKELLGKEPIEKEKEETLDKEVF